jgi:hypothetical protein
MELGKISRAGCRFTWPRELTALLELGVSDLYWLLIIGFFRYCFLKSDFRRAVVKPKDFSMVVVLLVSSNDYLGILDGLQKVPQN